eukprot:m.138305 g.138305  ORF g.138305 m.138305 type:complete len:300 (-) comp16069_c0_seq1:1301-2200(-)
MLFSEDPSWADVTPVPQDDGPTPACSIAYTDEFRDAMDYFRGVMHAKEMSQRALELTTRVIELNAANYTVWHYRRELLKGLEVNLNDELAFISNIIRDNLKNYQVWHHRQAVVTMLQDPSLELAFTEAMLVHDAKNYHAWTHRQWAMTTFNLFESAESGGLAYVDQLLKEDLWNNSAWSHRHFVITSTTGWTDEVVAQELEVTLRAIRLSPNNESSWNYLRGVVKSHGSALHQHSSVVDAVRELKEEGTAHSLAVWLDIMIGQGEIAQAQTVCDELATLDPIRRKYWAYRAQQLSAPST